MLLRAIWQINIIVKYAPSWNNVFIIITILILIIVTVVAFCIESYMGFIQYEHKFIEYDWMLKQKQYLNWISYLVQFAFW